MNLVTRFLGLAAIWGFCLVADGATPTSLAVTVDGLERQALVFGPTETAGKAPLILAFHGHGGNANAFAHYARLQEAWPEAVVVYPQGLPIPTDIDPSGLKPGWQRKPGELGDRDLKFVDALLEKFRENDAIDAGHVFAAGFSNGAFFVYLLWQERPQSFAGFAPVAGLPRFSGDPEVPKPAVQISGEADRLVHVNDVRQAMAMVRRLNGCSGRAITCGPGCSRYSSDKRAPVINWVHPGPHIYPPRATQVIVNFFKEIANR